MKTGSTARCTAPRLPVRRQRPAADEHVRLAARRDLPRRGAVAAALHRREHLHPVGVDVLTVGRVAILADEHGHEAVGAGDGLRGGDAVARAGRAQKRRGDRRRIGAVARVPAVEVEVPDDAGHRGVGRRRHPEAGSHGAGIAAPHQLHHDDRAAAGAPDGSVDRGLLRRDGGLARPVRRLRLVHRAGPHVRVAHERRGQARVPAGLAVEVRAGVRGDLRPRVVLDLDHDAGAGEAGDLGLQVCRRRPVARRQAKEVEAREQREHLRRGHRQIDVDALRHERRAAGREDLVHRPPRTTPSRPHPSCCRFRRSSTLTLIPTPIRRTAPSDRPPRSTPRWSTTTTHPPCSLATRPRRRRPAARRSRCSPRARRSW